MKSVNGIIMSNEHLLWNPLIFLLGKDRKNKMLQITHLNHVVNVLSQNSHVDETCLCMALESYTS
jgi:hypothetical protein